MNALQRTWQRLFGPPSTTGRDLRMILAIHATTPGDAPLQPVIEKAMLEHSEGKMHAGKVVEVTEDGGRTVVRVECLGYEQTWDGDADDQEP